jgi:ATP synthase F1 epsilon subunit
MKLTIVSLDQQIYQGDVQAVFAKSSRGAFEIRPGHAHFLAELVESDLYYDTPEGEREGVFISGGVLEARPDEVIVALDHTKFVDDIDETNVKERITHLRGNLQQSSIDYAIVLSELSAMTDQIRMINKLKKKK